MLGNSATAEAGGVLVCHSHLHRHLYPTQIFTFDSAGMSTGEASVVHVTTEKRPVITVADPYSGVPAGARHSGRTPLRSEDTLLTPVTVASLTMLFPKALRPLHTMPLQSVVVDCTLACEIMTENAQNGVFL